MTDSPTSKFRQIKFEKYYTPWATAHNLYDTTLLIVGSFADINAFDNFVEPSAGKGAFLACMPPDKRIGIDIDPWGWHYGKIGQEIVEQDFFNFVWPEGRTITIGNPPFGRRGKLAMKFLNISAENSEVVAFILPAIFSKTTFINRVHPYMQLIHETPVTEFETQDAIGEGPKVNCVFQIWKKSLEKRTSISRRTQCNYFTMTHRHISRTTPEELEQLKKDSTIAIRQVGGKVLSPEDVTKGSIWFIKGGKREVFESLDFSHLQKYHMGALSLSRADIVEGYLASITSQKAQSLIP